MEKIGNTTSTTTDNTNFTVGITAHSTIDIYKFIKSYKSVLNSFKIYKQNNPTRPLPHVILAIDTVRPEGKNEEIIKNIEQFNQEVVNFVRKAEEIGMPLQIIETTDNVSMVSTNRNNIINLCDTSHMVFVDGDDAIDEYAFDSIRENIDKHKDKENSFITMGQDGRTVWNILYKTSDLRKNDISFTKMYNEDGVFLGDLKLKGMKDIVGENVVINLNDYKASNSVDKFTCYLLLHFVLQIFDHLSKHNINNLSFNPTDETGTYNETNFKNIFQYFSDKYLNYECNAYDHMCNGALALFKRETNNMIYKDKFYCTPESILFSLSLYPEILDPKTEEFKFFTEVNKKLKDLFSSEKEDKLVNTINLLEIFNSINIDGITWNDTILPKIKDNFNGNMINDNYLNSVLQKFEIIQDLIQRILNKTDKSKTLHILNDPSNVSTIVDYENFLSYDKLKTERSREEIQILIKRVLKGKLLPNKAYDYTTEIELQNIIKESTVFTKKETKEETMQQFKQERGEFTLKMFLENNINLPMNEFEELCNLVIETVNEISSNINKEEINNIIQEYKEIKQILLMYDIDNIEKEEIFTTQSKYVFKKQNNKDIEFELTNDYEESWKDNDIFDKLMLDIMEDNDTSDELTLETMDEYILDENINIFVGKLTINELKLTKEQKEQFKESLEKFNKPLSREYKLNLKNIDFIKLKHIINNKHNYNSKNILFSNYIKDKKLFEILFEKQKEFYNNDKNKYFFTNKEENILQFLIYGNNEVFHFVLDEELKAFTENPKQIFFNNKKNIKHLKPSIINNANIDNIKLLIETAINILNTCEFNAFVHRSWDVLQNKFGKNYVDNIKRQLQAKQENERLLEENKSTNMLYKDLTNNTLDTHHQVSLMN